jgi:hypothetical protein
VDGIRTLAAIFYALGWIVLGVAGLAGVGLMLSGGFFASLTSVATLGAASLSPFFCWAVLEMLLEIYALQQSVLRATFRAAQAVASALDNPPLAVPPSSTPRSLPRAITVTAPDRAPQTTECPNCGRPNATWRSACADCQAMLA